MQYGLRVTLDPLGGNLVNVRELLASSGIVRPRFRVAVDSSSEESDTGEGGGSGDGEPGKAVNPRAGRTAAQLEDYDLDDDFIDDAEVVDDDFIVPDGPVGGWADAAAGKSGKRGRDGALKGKGKKKKKTDLASGMEPVFDGFYVSRGEIPMRPAGSGKTAKGKKAKNSGGEAVAKATNTQKKKTSVEKKAVAGPDKKQPEAPKTANVDRDQNAQSRPTSAPARGETVQKRPEKPKGVAVSGGAGGGANRRHVVAHEFVTAAPPARVENVPAAAAASVGAAGRNTSGGNGAAATGDGKVGPAPKRRKSGDGGSAVGKPLVASLQLIVNQMKAQCVELFGEKKPSINKSAELQESLDVLLREARIAGISKLIVDRQTISVPDELWRELDFLRTTRANLEGLGWALYWSGEEDNRKDNVSQAEKTLSEAVRESNGQGGETLWTSKALAALHTWWDARCALLEAMNHLRDPAKTKSVKKVQSSWIEGLAKCVLKEFNIGEDEIAGRIRVLEEAAAARDRERKEAERLERLERKKLKQAQKEARRKANAAEGSAGIPGPSGGGGILSHLDSLKKAGGGAGNSGGISGPAAGQGGSLVTPRALHVGGYTGGSASAGVAVKAAAAAAAAASSGAGRTLPAIPEAPPLENNHSGSRVVYGTQRVGNVLPAVPPPPPEHPHGYASQSHSQDQGRQPKGKQTHETIVID